MAAARVMSFPGGAVVWGAMRGYPMNCCGIHEEGKGYGRVLDVLAGRRQKPLLELVSQASVPRDAFPPTPPGPEGSNGNGLLRVQWVAGAWLYAFFFPRQLTFDMRYWRRFASTASMATFLLANYYFNCAVWHSRVKAYLSSTHPRLHQCGLEGTNCGILF